MRKVWLTQVGRSLAYQTWEAFAEEAKRLGFSRRVFPELEVRAGDIVLFGTVPEGVKLRRGEKVSYNLIIRGFGIVTSVSLKGKTPEAQQIIRETLSEFGTKDNGDGGSNLKVVRRGCGVYLVEGAWRVEDWDGFFKALRQRLKEKLGSMLYDSVILLVNGKFYELETPFQLPFAVTYSRNWRVLNESQVEAVSQLINPEAFVSDETPTIQLLAKYIQTLYRTKRDDKVAIKLPETDQTVKVDQAMLDIIL